MAYWYTFMIPLTLSVDPLFQKDVRSSVGLGVPSESALFFNMCMFLHECNVDHCILPTDIKRPVENETETLHRFFFLFKERRGYTFFFLFHRVEDIRAHPFTRVYSYP